MLSCIRAIGVAALAAATLVLGGSGSQAATIGFDYSGDTTTGISVAGSTGGTMSFTLDLGDPNGTAGIVGSFAMDVYNASHFLIGQIGFAGLGDGQTTSFGDVTGKSGGNWQDLHNVSTWSVVVSAADLPSLSLVITSSLGSAFGYAIDPVLSASFTGDLQTTPLPAALPLFATGAGIVTLLARKRRKAAIRAAA